MPGKQTPKQQEIVGRVMHEFKRGGLESAGGRAVRDPRQAIAIALREAGSSNQQSPAQNRRALRRTEVRERSGQARRARAGGGPSLAELYRRAKRENVPGRSKMNKDELQRALDAQR